MYELLSQQVLCPYCGEYFEILIDTSQDDCQYTEDCYVCCQPIVFTSHQTQEGKIELSARREDECF